jgi:hypothetical protein
MLFKDYLISIGGLFGLWQGLSIIDIKNKIYIIALFIINKIKLDNNMHLTRKTLMRTYNFLVNKFKVI